jgi:hemolysin III
MSFLSLLVLMVIADRAIVRAGAAVLLVAAGLLFTCSALYHTRTWSQEASIVWKRIDHANIFLLIAGSYTPFSLLLLSPGHAAVMLGIVWGGAILGILFKVFWIRSPRWVYVPLYILLGWAALIYWGEFADNAPTAVTVLLLVGGGLYTVGALVYGFRWPDPSPTWFGFHEIFHAFTIAAFVVHYVGVSVLAYSQS